MDWHRDEESSYDEGYATDLIGREAVRFIEASETGQPFLLYVAFNAPHDPMQAKEADLAKYAGVQERKRRIYCAMVDSMDQAIGRVLGALERKNLADDTFVLFFSDNGAMSWGDNKPWRGGKGSVYEGGVRTAAVARWPAGGIEGGRKETGLMGMIDVYPTLKRIAGVKTEDPNPLDGIDVLDVLRGETRAPVRDWFSYIAQGRPEAFAITDDAWKLVVTRGRVLEATIGSESPTPRVELFRLDRDPGETTNLIDEHPEKAGALLKRLQAHRRLKIEGIPDFLEGKEGFVAPREWKVE